MRRARPSLLLALTSCLPMVLSGCTEADAPDAETYDVLVVGGELYDGSGSPPRAGNIGIRGDLIVTLNAADDAPSTARIDATGKAVMPGFIDPHTHALEDLTSPDRNANANYLAQGVTTVFVGNDGGGIEAPEATLAHLARQGIGTNMAFYVGHNRVRSRVMGLANRPPDNAELTAMRELVAAGMRRGALGLSTGLYYTPGSYASTEEVIALAQVAAEFGGVYDSHLRDESSYSIGLTAAIDEVIRIAREASIPAHIAHIKALGRDVWGEAAAISEKIEAARAEGLKITADQYPYTASGTRLAAALIPAAVRADSPQAMFARLADPDQRDAILDAMHANLRRRGGPETLLITDPRSRWRGSNLAEIATQLELEPVLAAIEVVREGDPGIASFNMQRDDLKTFAAQPWVMTGSDGSRGHPRKYATYPTVYEDMVRGGWFSTARFVARSAGQVADTFGLCDRGYLEVGRKADLIVVDLDVYAANATFENPEALAGGVVHALVNGQPAISNSVVSPDLHGTIINRQTLPCSASTAS